MTTSNTPYAELVKRPWLCGVTGNPVGTDTRMIGEPPCDCQGCRAARAIDSLQAQVEVLREALEPFARMAERLECHQRDQNTGVECVMSVREMNRARDTYAALNQAGTIEVGK